MSCYGPSAVACSLLLATAIVGPRAAGAAPPEEQADAKQLGIVLRCGPPTTAQVALTFDDGPAPGATAQILTILRQQRVQAAFFVLGRLARRYPQLVQRIAAEGHLVANHSWDHPKRISAAAWRQQISRTAAAIQRAGVAPASYFRPPHGLVSPALRQATAELGYPIILYTLLSSDWRRPGAEALEKQVVGRLAQGGIVVLHDGGGDRRQTVAALPAIIRGLRQRGLEPVRLDQLLGEQPAAQPCARRFAR